jgi:hypothetical protein
MIIAVRKAVRERRSKTCLQQNLYQTETRLYRGTLPYLLNVACLPIVNYALLTEAVKKGNELMEGTFV